MQHVKYLMGKQQLKEPLAAAELCSQFGSGNIEPELDQMYKEQSYFTINSVWQEAEWNKTDDKGTICLLLTMPL